MKRETVFVWLGVNTALALAALAISLFALSRSFA